MKYHLILNTNLAEKLIFQMIYLPTFTENLGSNLIQVAKLLSNIGMKLLALSNSQENFQQLSWEFLKLASYNPNFCLNISLEKKS